ncbi:MAG: VWA domain-containing protein [Pirellulaceae bacterium]|nr:VWA domain-containing protein [Pirellulaceae bacterium]
MIRSKQRLQPSRRRGAIIVMVAVFLVILIAMAAFSIDLAYIQLAQTQLKAACDGAAKAGTSALVQGKTDAQAIQAAIDMAALNSVNGKAMALKSSDITLGQSQLQADGTWKFVPGAKPSQAMQVIGSLNGGNSNGSVGLFFAPLIGTSSVTLSNTSEASAFAVEVCLALDRSHSMCFDQTGTTWSYPPPILLDWVQGIKTDPVAGSRWESLDTAINSFCGILKTSNYPPRVAVVTWASEIGKSTTEYSLTGQTSPAVVTDLGLSTDMNAVYAAINSRSKNVMLGGTNMSVGIDQARTVLNGANVKPYAKKVMILMTDGQWNQGRDPLLAAADAAAEKITIHCICFLQNADQTTTKQIAAMTGGKFYYASNAAALDAAFKDLAYSLPVVLTK